MIGELTPLVLSILLGILFGYQIKGRLDPKILPVVIVFGIGAAFLLGAFPFFTSWYGGFIAPGYSFANTFLGALVGVLIGYGVRRK